jgi:glycerophosphoryl diester phosphodiesterase
VDDLPPGFDCFEDLVRYTVTELGIDGLFTDFPDRVLALRMP